MLDRTSPIPLHTQMEETIREKLDSGEWSPGQPISSENELSRVYGVSRMTARNVLTKLVHEGLLERIPGKGTFVKNYKITATPLSYAGIREQLERMGYEVSTKVLSVEVQTAAAEVQERFALPPEARYYVVRRLRFVKEEPLSLHVSYLPLQFCPDLHLEELEHEQLCVILNQSYGLKPVKTEETLESVAATREEAALLQVKTGYPLLRLEDSIYRDERQIYEYAQVIFRGDKIKLHLSF